jgi:hypothetical protein
MQLFVFFGGGGGGGKPNVIVGALVLTLKADSHIACRAHAVPLPCCALIHICPAAPLPCSDSAVSFEKVRMVAGNIRTASLFCSVPLPLFTVVGMDRCEGEWYASDNKLHGTPHGSRKKPNAGR